LKVIQLHKKEEDYIKKAIKQKRSAQQYLFNLYAPKMLSVCRQYIKDIHFAEEVMLNGFLKVFTNLKKFKFEGSFEGWVRRIMINEAISFLRRKKDFQFINELPNYQEDSWNNIDEDFNVEQIQELIDALPKGYKVVFVLYIVEGYKHHEIAKTLNISENTSKSQLFKARKLLQKKLEEQNKLNYAFNKI